MAPSLPAQVPVRSSPTHSHSISPGGKPDGVVQTPVGPAPLVTGLQTAPEFVQPTLRSLLQNWATAGKTRVPIRMRVRAIDLERGRAKLASDDTGGPPETGVHSHCESRPIVCRSTGSSKEKCVSVVWWIRSRLHC